MNDIFFYVIALIAFFVLWLYAGGPTSPISFAGPYITPITDTGVQSVGYDDPSAHNTSFWGAWSGNDDDSYDSNEVIESAKSPYAGQVEIGSSEPEENDVRSEYILIRSDARDDVTITGWQLVSAASGRQVRIPEGSESGNSKRAIRLEPDESALIVTGSRASEYLKDWYSGTWRAYLGEKNDIWRDSSDTITLLDATGKVVDQYSY